MTIPTGKYFLVLCLQTHRDEDGNWLIAKETVLKEVHLDSERNLFEQIAPHCPQVIVWRDALKLEDMENGDYCLSFKQDGQPFMRIDQVVVAA